MQTTQPPRRPPTTRPVTPKAHDTELVDTMDDLLDDIDAILKENAIETMRAYRQTGGQ
jgi:ubiquitin-like protein Pup